MQNPKTNQAIIFTCEVKGTDFHKAVPFDIPVGQDGLTQAAFEEACDFARIAFCQAFSPIPR